MTVSSTGIWSGGRGSIGASAHRRIAGGIVGYFDSRDFQRGNVNVAVDLAPLATILGSVLLGLSLTSPGILMPVLLTRR
jgi:hypothetical protein